MNKYKWPRGIPRLIEYIWIECDKVENIQHRLHMQTSNETLISKFCLPEPTIAYPLDLSWYYPIRQYSVMNQNNNLQLIRLSIFDPDPQINKFNP